MFWPFPLARLCGLLLISLAGTVIAGWALRIPTLVQIAPGYTAMALNTAIGFAVGGVALVLPPSRARARALLGLAIFVLAALVFAQIASGRAFGIDWPHLHAWLADGNPHPGRMAPNTAVAFMLAGAVLMLTARATMIARVLVQLFTFLILLLGLLSLVGYTLQLDLLYRWYRYTRMSLLAASGFLVFAIGLASLWYNSAWFERMYRGHEDRKIGALAAAILAATAFTGGLLSFVTLEDQTERALSQSLELAVHNRAELLMSDIEQRLKQTQGAAQRVAAQRRYANGGADPHAALRTIARTLLGEGYSAIELRDAHGAARVRVGQPVNDASFRVPLADARSQLLWRDGIWLRSETPLIDHGISRGVLITEQALPSVQDTLFDTHSLGATGETAVCARVDERLHCLPTRLSADPFVVATHIDGKELPMNRALRGERGVGIARDYRHENVIAAYAPMASLGLGVVIKMDTAELYAPIRQRLHQLLPLLLASVIGGVLLLRWQIVPLVRKLVASEHAAVEKAEVLARLASIVESSHDAIIGMDLNGRIVTWNSAAQRLYGYRPEEIIGSPISRLAPPALADEEMGFIRRTIQGDRIDNYETRRITRDGTPLEVALTLSPICSDDGRIIGISKIARDITERKRQDAKLQRTTEELARSNRELEQFAYVASHDLQEPLRMIGSYTQLLARRYRGKLDASADEFIGYVVDGAKRMQRLIEDLLSYSRVTTQAAPFASVDCNAVVDRVLQDLRIAIADADANVTRDVLPTVFADAIQLTQLWQNLIANAIKFHGERPARVHIGCRARDSMWEFFVRDEGIGIDPQFADRIFVIFQRLHGRSEYPGTGIGLALCKKIVERHGGEIWVDSQPGAGATFYFTLPNTGSASS